MTKLQENPAEVKSNHSARKPVSAPLRPHVLAAIFHRNVMGYFSNPAGYVFISLFVFVCSWAEFLQPAFFGNNLANLEPMNQWIPYILLFFVPAITMSTWAEERRQGTEELLLTLPARDIEVVLGKYFAALGIFSVALVFLAVGHWPLLAWLGDPDWGVLLVNYFGIWLIGAMLIAFGMVASILSANITVGFILGAVFCAVPVFAQLIGSPSAGRTRRVIEGLSIASQFRDFGFGVVPIPNVFYFVTLAAGMLYLNMILLGRRHWAGGPERWNKWGHALTRFIALVVALVSFDVLVERALGSWRVDATAERLHTLSPISRKIVKDIPRDRPVFIQAYIEPDVPREYVQTRMNLVNALKEFAALGGNKVKLNIIETKKFTKEAREAEKRFGITPRDVPTTEDKNSTKTIFLGVAFSSGTEEVVVPFFDRGLPVEYEVARSIRVVSGTKRKRVGILSTDAKLLGGMDFQTFSPNPEWEIVTELKKQYDVTQISPDTPIPSDLDALIVAQPSSMPQRQIANLSDYIRKGGATLLLVDPFPAFDRSLAPSEERTPPGGRNMFGGPPPEPKGDLRPLMEMIGVDWPQTEIVWNRYNPHPQLDIQQPEIMFIGKGSGASDVFSTEPVTAGLQEVVLLFAGLVRPQPGAKTDFAPLLRTNDRGGLIAYEDIMPRRDMFSQNQRRDRRYIAGLTAYTLAAKVSGTLPAESAPPPLEGDKAPPPPPKPRKANVIVVADIDFIADNFFQLRRKTSEMWDIFDFDNVTFALNCVDELVGDEAFIPLRNRRAKHRTLTRVEDLSKKFITDAQAGAKKAEDEARTQLEEAQKRLTDEVEKVRASKEYDEKTKESIVEQRQEFEQRRLDVLKSEIDDRKRSRIEDSFLEKEANIVGIQNRIKLAALIWPVLPAILLGGFVFALRASRENIGATPTRIARVH